MAVESADNRGRSRPPMTPTMPPNTGAVGVRVNPPAQSQEKSHVIHDSASTPPIRVPVSDVALRRILA
jgi:hypothetical protein